MNQRKQSVRHLIIVPSESSGAELIKSLGVANGTALGIETATVLSLAKKQVSGEMFTQRVSTLSVTEAVMLMLRALKACQGKLQYFHQLNHSLENAQGFYQTYIAFRKSIMLPPQENLLKSLVKTLANEEKAHDLETVFATYESLKALPVTGRETTFFNGPQWDEADVLSHALSLSKKPANIPNPIHLWLPACAEYTPLEEAFVKNAYHPVEYVSLENLPGVLGLEALSKTPVAATHNLTGYGEMNEIKGLIKQIKNGFQSPPVSLEDVVIGVVDYGTYAPLFQQAGQRYNLPITFGSGLPMVATNPGRLVRQMLRWMNSRKAEAFRDMVYGGSFRIHHWVSRYREQALKQVQESLQDIMDIKGENLTPSVSSRHVTKLMMDLRIGDMGPSEQERLTRCQQLAVDEISSLWQNAEKNKDNLTGKDKHSFNQWLRMLASTFFINLFFQDLTQSPWVRCKTIMETYGWIRWNNADRLPSGDKTWAQQRGIMDSEALKIIKEALNRLSEEESLSAISKCLEFVLSSTNLGQSSSKPGHLHLVPWQNLAWVWRKHVCIAGLDQERFPGMAAEDPLLLDEEKRSLLAAAGTTPEAIPEHPFLKGAETFKKRRHMNALLNTITRRATTLVVSSTNFNLTEYRPTLPDLKSVQALSLDAGKPTWENGFINPKGTALDEAEYWLRLKEDMPRLLAEAASTFEPLRRLAAIKENRNKSTPTAWDGQVKGMSMTQLTEKAWSPSRLESLGKCPFKFFAENLLGIPEPEKENLGEDTWLEATERGSIIHQLAEYYLEQAKLGSVPDEEALLQMLYQEAERKAASKAPPSRMVYDREVNKMEALCRNIIKMETSYRKMLEEEGLDLLPGNTVTEHQFDVMEVPLTLPAPEECQAIKLHGRLDRMDELHNGDRVIIDYKSGGHEYNTPGCFDQGRQLQLYLYSLMAEKQWGVYPREAFYFFLKGSNADVMRAPAALSQEQREKTLQWLTHFCQLWQQGEFLLTDDFQKDCAFCPYESVCNKDQYSQEVLAQKWEATRHAREVRSID